MDRSVPSAGNTGPRDFSAAVHSNVTGRGTGFVIAARVRLPDDEGVAEIDVFEALKSLLASRGQEKARVEVWREGDGNSPVLTSGRTV